MMSSKYVLATSSVLQKTLSKSFSDHNNFLNFIVSVIYKVGLNHEKDEQPSVSVVLTQNNPFTFRFSRLSR